MMSNKIMFGLIGCIIGFCKVVLMQHFLAAFFNNKINLGLYQEQASTDQSYVPKVIRLDDRKDIVSCTVDKVFVNLILVRKYCFDQYTCIFIVFDTEALFETFSYIIILCIQVLITSVNIRYSKNKHIAIMFYIELSVHTVVTFLPLLTIKPQNHFSQLRPRRNNLFLLSLQTSLMFFGCLQYN